MPPHAKAQWLSEPEGINAGYVTYNIDGTGGQGYVYMHWHLLTAGTATYDARAGGLYTITITHPGWTEYTLRCVIPGC